MKSTFIILLVLLLCEQCHGQYYRLIFEGDSITEGTGVGSKTNTYGRWLTNYFWTCTNVTKWVNNGISSSKISDCANRYTNLSLGNVSQYKPSGGTNAILFLECGVNNVSFSTPATAELIWEEYSNYMQQAKSDGFTTVGMTITTNINWGAPSRAIAIQLRSIMLANYSPVCDYLIDAATVLPNGQDPNQFVDGLHWSLEGHKMMATNIASIITVCPGDPTPGPTVYSAQRLYRWIGVTP
jgi:lysophospholipase L1-like esterase